MLLNHGVTLFGSATDDPQSFAKTVLGVISYMFGGPIFISKMLPIAKLYSFLYEQIGPAVDGINQWLSVVKAVICNGNRNNQAFFKIVWHRTTATMVK